MICKTDKFDFCHRIFRLRSVFEVPAEKVYCVEPRFQLFLFCAARLFLYFCDCTLRRVGALFPHLKADADGEAEYARERTRSDETGDIGKEYTVNTA